MNAVAALVALMVLALGSGCSAKVTQTREKVTPTSYNDYQSNVKRSVGLLRRLLVLPPQYTYIHNWKRRPEMEASQSTLMREGATGFLRDWKGYEIIPYPEIQDTGGKEAPPAQSQPDPGLKTFYEWAENSEVDAPPPAEVKNLVSDLSRRFGADGVLVLQGFQRPPSTWTAVSTILTASLTWPLLFIEMKGKLRANIYEASSGRIVWRSRMGLFDASKPIRREEIERLLGSLENAAPAALINR
jgi:hypothetical protein